MTWIQQANRPALAAVGRRLGELQQISVWSAWMIPPSTPALARLQILFIQCFLPGALSAPIPKMPAALPAGSLGTAWAKHPASAEKDPVLLERAGIKPIDNLLCP